MIRWFIEHKTAANMVMIILLVLGWMTVSKIRRETMPDFSSERVQISIAYPGATAEEVEEAVCVPVEEALDGISGIDEITSRATEGSGIITVDMIDGNDYQEFYNDIKSEVEAIDSFPAEVERITVKAANRTDLVVSVAITGDMSDPHLKAYCQQLKEKIEQLTKGAQVSIEGFSQHEFRIEISQSRLEAYGLSVSDIAEVINRQNTDLSAGILETDGKDIVLRFSERCRDIRSLEQMKIVAGESGAEITLGALGKITDRFDKDEQKVIFNGKRAGIVNVVKAKSFDSLKIFAEVEKVINQVRETAPKGVNFYITRNVASIVKDRLDMLIENGIQGIILVFFTLWLFLSLRLSFWVAMGLPISFVGGLFFLHLFGITINMISMVALLVAIGLLMDDAIVLSQFQNKKSLIPED